MNNELNTLLTTLYVFLDDLVLPRLGLSRARRPGRKPVLSDAKLLCLVAAQHLLQFDSEARWIRYASTHLTGMFPARPRQPGYNKRVRATGYGYCASHSRYFWGFRLYLSSTPEGMPVIWALANPKIGEREVTQAMLEHDHHLIRHGQVIVGDKGFAGRDFEAVITDQLGATLIRPDRKDEKPRFGRFSGIRQWIESVFDTLKGQLGLERHGGRTLAGVYARVGAKLLALAAAIWHNWAINAPRKRSLIAYDH
ncbi:Mobile element protein [Leifsonia rubra CMS 76R]|nr:Mobile element protein [Leifsonia rubra CMS 76R]